MIIWRPVPAVYELVWTLATRKAARTTARKRSETIATFSVKFLLPLTKCATPAMPKNKPLTMADGRSDR